MPATASDLVPILRLALVPGIGPLRLAALLARFGAPEAVLRARPAEVARLPGFGRALAARVAQAAGAEAGARAREALRRLEGAGARAATLADSAYPPRLRELADPPVVVFLAGDAGALDRPGLGVVGTRTPTPYGRAAAESLSGELSRAGYAIVSGMARGIDAAAHGAALAAEGPTIGVLGHGIDRVYPPENRALFRRVRERGLLLSELPPGEEPRAGNFPRRNRLIAALSAGVLVVEMGERSGARHTVDAALELGREVFAVPGPIGSPTSAGTNQLLKEGARLVTGARDVLEELRGVGLPSAPPSREVAAPPLPPPDLAPEEARVLAALALEPRHVDAIAAALALPTSRVLAALLALELRDLAEALPGKLFRVR